MDACSLRGLGHRNDTVERASYPKSSAAEDVRVDHRGAHIAMSQEFLDRSNIVAKLKQFCREGVAKHVAADRLWDIGSDCGRPNSALHDRFVNMMTSDLPGPRLPIDSRRREKPLPR